MLASWELGYFEGEEIRRDEKDFGSSLDSAPGDISAVFKSGVSALTEKAH